MASNANQIIMQNQIKLYETTIKGQNDLIDKQAKLIHVLASTIEKNGLLDKKEGHQGGDNPADNPPGDNPSDKDSESTSYGPHSPSIKWTGEQTDLIKVTIGSTPYKAIIMDEAFVHEWNWLLNLRRKIPKYKAEHSEECEAYDHYEEIFEECKRLKQSGDDSEDTSRSMNKATIGRDAAATRAHEIWNKLERLTHTKKILNKRIARFVRFVLWKNNERTLEDMTWLDELRASKEGKYKDRTVRFNERFEDEETNRVPPNEQLELPPPAPASENTDSQESDDDSSQGAAA